MMSSINEVQKKKLILSSSGLKNIIFNNNYFIEDSDFRFIFGSKEIKMNRFIADFISPRVSHIHYSDMTADSINLGNMLHLLLMINNSFENNIEDDISTLFNMILDGNEIEINPKMSHQLKLLAVLIGNEELYQKVNVLFPTIQNENEVDTDKMIQYLIKLNDVKSLFNDNQIIDFLAKNFFSIQKESLLELPKAVIYSIISNENLKLENEDSLIDFIYDLHESKDKEESVNIIAFLEQVDFTSLSEEKFAEIIELIEPNSITKSLWEKFCKCINAVSSMNTNASRYVSLETSNSTKTRKIIQIPFDFDTNHRFEGIISYFTKAFGGNVHDKSVIEVTSSSIRSDRTQPKYAVDFSMESSTFISANVQGSWLCYDFKERKVKPTYYSIRTWNALKGRGHLKNWSIQGSNDGKSWRVLDTRAIEMSLDGRSASNTFDVHVRFEPNDFYRYLRIIQTGLNSGGDSNLMIHSLEFFGDVLEQGE